MKKQKTTHERVADRMIAATKRRHRKEIWSALITMVVTYGIVFLLYRNVLTGAEMQEKLELLFLSAPVLLVIIGLVALANRSIQKSMREAILAALDGKKV